MIPFVKNGKTILKKFLSKITFRVACVQTLEDPKSPKTYSENLDNLKSLIYDAAVEHKANLILLPEMASNRFEGIKNFDYKETETLTTKGATCEILSKLSQHLNVCIGTTI